MKRLLCLLLSHRWEEHTVLYSMSSSFGHHTTEEYHYMRCTRCGAKHRGAQA